MKIDLHTHIVPKTWLEHRYRDSGFIGLEHVDSRSTRMMQDAPVGESKLQLKKAFDHVARGALEFSGRKREEFVQ